MSVMNQRLTIKYHEGCVYIMHHGNAKKYHGPLVHHHQTPCPHNESVNRHVEVRSVVIVLIIVVLPVFVVVNVIKLVE